MLSVQISFNRVSLFCTFVMIWYLTRSYVVVQPFFMPNVRTSVVPSRIRMSVHFVLSLIRMSVHFVISRIRMSVHLVISLAPWTCWLCVDFIHSCVRACVRARAFVCILVWFLVPQCRKLNVNVAYGYDEIDHYCNNKTMSDRYYKSRLFWIQPWVSGVWY